MTARHGFDLGLPGSYFCLIGQIYRLFRAADVIWEYVVSNDYLTVLRSAGLEKISTFESKKYHIVSSSTFEARECGFVSIPVNSLLTLSAALGKIRKDPNNVIIRGQPKLGVSSVWPRGLRNSIQETSHQWCLLDINGLDLPAEYSDASKFCTELLLHVLDFLPLEFQDAHFWYDLLASGRQRQGSFKLHLWFWLDRKVSDAEMKIWLKDYPVDLRLFHPIQMHFLPRTERGEEAVGRSCGSSGLFLAGAKGTVPVPSNFGHESACGRDDPPSELPQFIAKTSPIGRARSASRSIYEQT